MSGYNGHMLDALWWFITVEAVGLAAFPLAYFLLPRLADRGYTVAKPLGLLLLGYASWILSTLHILPSVRLSFVALLLVMAALSGWYLWRHLAEFKDFVSRERKTLIAGEAIFLVFFVGWVAYRFFDPAIDHTEQPMDFAFLNASIQSQFGSPEDPWLRGESVSYYYFGYWMMGAVSQLSGIPSNISYNLSLAVVPALGAMAIFGLVYNIAKSETVRWRPALVAGVGAAAILGITANLEGVLEFMRANALGSQGFWDWVRIDGLDTPLPATAESWAPEEYWWWFRATRVINTFDGAQWTDYTIQEFPFFSFMLGDLHPHVMSIPFVLLFLAFCWNYLWSPLQTWRGIHFPGYVAILALGAVLGALTFTNMWDGPTFGAMFLGVAILKTYSSSGGGLWTLLRGVVPVGVAVAGVAVLLFIPYYLTFSGSVTGIDPVPVTTRPIHLFIVWGLYLVAIAPLIIVAFLKTVSSRDWPIPTGLAVLLVLVPYLAWAFLHLDSGGTTGDLLGRFLRLLPIAMLLGLAVFSAIATARRDGPNGRSFALALSALGLLLIIGPELIFVGDPFNNRMNTVFKLYYQAWILLAAASGLAIYYWGSLWETLYGWRRSLAALWAAAFVVLLAGSLYYPPAAATSKGGPFNNKGTLDGLAFVARSRPAEYEAIQFIRNNIGHGSAIVESVGEWFDAGLISRSTGVPTVLNWPGHELQWRGSMPSLVNRELDVSVIYQTQDAEEARILLARYDVEYVYVGPREREKYGIGGLDKFSSFMETVFAKDDVAIYRVRP